jgi:hypothetical protein
MVDGASRGYRLSGDAQAVANMVALAKMRAAAQFTRVRVHADLNGRRFRLESWDKAAGAWVPQGGTVGLSNGVNFGFGALAAPPPNTQAAISQSPPCTNPGGGPGGAVAAIDDSACIVFNSRGVPIDDVGAPQGGNALYITDGASVYATTITATPLVRQWWSNAAVAAWVRR